MRQRSIGAAAFTLAFLLPVYPAQSTPPNPLVKSGWTLVFNDEFDQSSLGDLFNSSGLWCSVHSCWDPGGDGTTTYTSPVPAWTNIPAGCQQPAINTSLTGLSSLNLTVRKNPGNYATFRFPSATLVAGSVWVKVSSLRDLAVGNSVADAKGLIPPNTTITSVLRGNFIKLSKTPTGSASNDMLSVLTCAPFTYTAGGIDSKRQFLYGYFEIRAKIPLRGNYTWPSFWLWGADSPQTYREIDIYEFGTPNIRDNVLLNLHLAQGIDGGAADSGVWNDYPSTYIVKNPDGTAGNVTQDFHIYAAKWTPNSVTWYVDNRQVYRVAGHAPHYQMRLLVGTGIQPWITTSDSVLPTNYEIDYVRAYRNDAKEFMFQWGNGGSAQLGSWNMGPADVYFPGRFEGNGKSQLLAITPGKGAHLLGFIASSWASDWSTGGGGTIGMWPVALAGTYVVGNFAQQDRDQLLAISPIHGAALVQYNGSTWVTPWFTGSKKIGPWTIRTGDQHVAGDFDGDGNDELLTVAPDGAAQMLRYAGGTNGAWLSVWSNGGSGKINDWDIRPGDQYLAGDFSGQGQKQVLAIANNGMARLYRFNGSAWDTAWTNNGSGKFDSWTMGIGDKYRVGKFEGGKQDHLLVIGGDRWWSSQLLSFSGGAWTAPWKNDDGARVHTWYMKATDRYWVGDFNGGGKHVLVAVGSNGWSQLLAYVLP